MVVCKALLLLCLGYICYQDIQQRAVYGFLFPILICLLGYLHYRQVALSQFIWAIGMNMAAVAILVLTLYVYAAWRIKRPFFKEVFGLGDLLFFVALAIAFPTVTFIVLWVCSIFFAVVLWGVLKKRAMHHTVPLAGYMAAFLAIVFLVNWIAPELHLYRI